VEEHEWWPPDDRVLARADNGARVNDGAGRRRGSADRSKGLFDPSNSVSSNVP